MSSIVKHTDKRTGITYCYRSTSYWDKEKQQPRSHRQLIGKIDPETGEMVPTGPKGRPRTEKDQITALNVKMAGDPLAEKDRRIRSLEEENRKLRREKEEILTKLRDLLAVYTARED